MSPSFFCFMIMYMISFMFVISMDEWFMIWFGLEMNMLSFIILIYSRNNMFNIESCMKYFFIQSLGSAILVSSFYLNNKNFEIVSCYILSYKMGGGPFFFWFPILCSGISWLSCYFLMTFQKFLPMILVSKIMNWSMWVIILISLMVGVFGSLNQNEIKRLMAYSSIHQIGWLLMFMYIDEYMWLIYYLIYMIILWPLIFMFMKNNVNSLLSISYINNKWLMILMFLNMGGMPPMLGFFLKWLGLYYFMNLNKFIIILMVLMSVIMFYVYLRVCYIVLMEEKIKISWMNEMNKYYYNSIEIVLLMGILLGGIIMFILLM